MTKIIVLYTEGSSGNARGQKRPLGVILIMVEDDMNANIVDYGSIRCHRVTRSVLESEIHAMVVGFDIAFVVQNMFKELLGTKMKIQAYVDSRSVFDVIAKQGNTVEKRLKLDIPGMK